MSVVSSATNAPAASTSLTFFAFLGTLLAGGAFGVFYAWVSTTMWGLDAAPPEAAVPAMQHMNMSVRNAVFFPVFFLTPVALAITAALAWAAGNRPAASYFGAAALASGLGCVLFTMVVLVPMNEAFNALPFDTPAEAAAIWADYSPTWQSLNQLRTGFCGAAFLLALIGLRQI